jgi:hypothetical protein
LPEYITGVVELSLIHERVVLETNTLHEGCEQPECGVVVRNPSTERGHVDDVKGHLGPGHFF